ncbi:diaminopropionate ammonia-lyase [bacterium]|nr:diaminopropionate ammonia-lyase [bacterium]MBU3929533.1 diaminopropionate ammonia-lyase [bacterium]
MTWFENKNAGKSGDVSLLNEVMPRDIARLARSFHRQIPDYRITPLKSLNNLAAMLKIGGIWVKDESLRLNLNSFKVLGGSFAIYRFIKHKLGIDHLELPFSELISPEIKKKLGKITFATATDGNHGRGVAWAASKLGHKAVIYVHQKTSVARVQAITSYGAEVKIVKGTYDDAVKKVIADARKYGWQIISDTSWKGYREIPLWVMQGYTSLLSEVQEQLASQGVIKPTHIFVQAGVGALAASMIGYYRSLMRGEAPISIVVEPDRAACLFKSIKMKDGKPHKVKGNLNTAMAGLACGEPSPIAWEILKNYANFFIACPEYVASKGMRVYGMPLKGDPTVVSGESGAVTLGALMFILENPKLRQLKKQLALDKNSQVLFINTEGNTDPTHFREVVWDGADPVPDK